MNEQFSPTRSETDDAYPAYWDWDREGKCDGTFVRVEQGSSVYGPTPIVVVEVGGVERSVWLNSAALKSKFAEELARRAERDFVVGERLSIVRGATKKVSASDRSYWPFVVAFPDGPRMDAASLLGDPAADVVASNDDRVPFS